MAYQSLVTTQTGSGADFYQTCCGVHQLHHLHLGVTPNRKSRSDLTSAVGQTVSSNENTQKAGLVESALDTFLGKGDGLSWGTGEGLEQAGMSWLLGNPEKAGYSHEMKEADAIISPSN